MKVLLLSVALLLFTGAQGRHFWQQDEPKQEETAEKSLEKLFHDGWGMLVGALESIDYPAISKEYQVKERLDAARKHMNKLEKAIESYYDEVYKRLGEQLDEKFPVFSKNVLPKLKEFDDALEEHAEKIIKKVIPVGTDLVAGISNHIVSSFERLESIAVDSRDKLREEMDKLRVSVQPYVDDVHAEYERYRNNLQGELQKDMKELKQDVEKNMEMLKERAKPHIERLKSKIPDGKEFQKNVEQFLNELKEALSKED